MAVISRFCERYALDVLQSDLVHLRAIGAAFSHLPYENITKILKEARGSSPESKLRMTEEVLEDHIRWKTGGTCFSLCNALLDLLEASGYRAHIGMADMHYGANIHCAVIVTLAGGSYLMDPGYLLHTPVRIPEIGSESRLRTPMNEVIVRRESGDALSVHTLESGQEKWRYRLRIAPVTRDEFVAHWIRSFSLNSMEQILLSRLSDEGRLYYRKNRLDCVGPEERTRIQLPAHASEEIAAVFGIPADMIRLAQRAVLIRPA